MYESPKGNVIKLMARGFGGFTPPETILETISSEEAHLKPEQSPYAIIDLVAHMQFWQAWALDIINTKEPVAASQDWQDMRAADWERVRADFLAGLATFQHLAEDDAVLARAIKASDPGLGRHTVGSLISNLVLHNAHHLGQVILLRRMMGHWPS